MFGNKKLGKVGMSKDQVYNQIKSAFDSAGMKYGERKDEHTIVTGCIGDDLPMRINVIVNDVTIRFVGLLDFKTESDNYTKVAWELNCINKNLVFGSFYLNPDDGYVMFEEAFPYKEAQVSESFILAFTAMIGETVDQYDGNLKQIAEKVPRSDDFPNPMYG